jgi:hypothetical protein
MPTRQPPADPIVLHSGALDVVLDRRHGLPCEYHLQPTGLRLRGEDLGVPIVALLCRLQDAALLRAPVVSSSAAATALQADFRFQAADEGRAAASFRVKYALSGASLSITLEDVREHDGYELLELAMPRLASVREDDGAAWLAHGDDGGHLASLAEAQHATLPPNTFWGDVLTTLPVVMIGTERVLCVQEVTAYMDGTKLTVSAGAGKRAALGTIKRHRVNGQECFDMNTGPSTPRVCGERRTPNLLVGQTPACRLDFLAAAAGQALDWLAGAELVRSRMPALPSRYYDSRFFYGIHCDEPRAPEPQATFEQCERLIRNVASLIDEAPQLVRLSGWQSRGKDTGFPAIEEVNTRLGGHAGLLRLMEEAGKAGCTAILTDNYDDAYKSSPAWDPGVVARRPDGELWKSRNWTGEDSYVIGPAKYMSGPGPERVRRTCERYRLREAIFIDALSYFSIRNDWDPAHPASGVKNLLEGRHKVLDEFSARGIDVNSEALRYAFLGRISGYWYMPKAKACPFGGVPIPLLPAVYRQSAVWGQSVKSGADGANSVHAFFHNACPRVMVDARSDLRELTDLFYLYAVPWFRLRGRRLETFRREGSRSLLGLEGGSRVEIDPDTLAYLVVVEGTTVARDGSTFCPLDDERIAFYSRSEQELVAELPPTWRESDVVGLVLSADEPQELPVIAAAGSVRVRVPSRRPVMVYRDRGSAGRRRGHVG